MTSAQAAAVLLSSRELVTEMDDAMTDAAQPDIVEHVSSTDFASTVQRIADALAEAGLMLFAGIDHAAGARDAGMEMPPATVLI